LGTSPRREPSDAMVSDNPISQILAGIVKGLHEHNPKAANVLRELFESRILERHQTPSKLRDLALELANTLAESEAIDEDKESESLVVPGSR